MGVGEAEIGTGVGLGVTGDDVFGIVGAAVVGAAGTGDGGTTGDLVGGTTGATVVGEKVCIGVAVASPAVTPIVGRTVFM